MLRRGIVAGLVLLLGIALATSMTGCFEVEEIWHCLRDGTERWFGRAPLTLCFEAEVDYNGIVTWEFGDGATGAGEIVSHTYTEVGVYEVVMDVVYTSGKLATVTQTVVVADDPVAAFSHKPIPTGGLFNITAMLAKLMPALFPDYEEEEQEDSLTVQFDARPSYPTHDSLQYRPASVAWDFGDGTQETKNVGSNIFSSAGRMMMIKHEYAEAGVYDVTLTLTDNLGFSDTVTQTITVGTPGEPEPDEEDYVIEQFTLTSADWELDDEEEEGCLAIYGSVLNAGPLDAGIQLTATAYAGAVAVGSFSHWVAGVYNITAGVDYQYSFFLCNLTVPVEQVTSVEVVISDGVVY